MRNIIKGIAFTTGRQCGSSNRKVKYEMKREKERERTVLLKSYAYLINTGIKFLTGISVRLMERFLVLTYT